MKGESGSVAMAPPPFGHQGFPKMVPFHLSSIKEVEKCPDRYIWAGRYVSCKETEFQIFFRCMSSPGSTADRYKQRAFSANVIVISVQANQGLGTLIKDLCEKNRL